MQGHCRIRSSLGLGIKGLGWSHPKLRPSVGHKPTLVKKPYGLIFQHNRTFATLEEPSNNNQLSRYLAHIYLIPGVIIVNKI